MSYTTVPTFSIGQNLSASTANTLGTAVTELQTGSPAPWTSWSPSLTSTGTAPTASTAGFYVQFGKIVYAKLIVNITTAGTGTYALSLPVTADTNAPQSLTPVGTVRIVIGGSSWIGWAEILTTTTMRFGALTAIGSTATVTQTSPGTFASGSTINGTITYAAA